jgi:hypothetical protein
LAASIWHQFRGGDGSGRRVWLHSLLEVQAVADNSGLMIKAGLAGAAAWLAYKQGWLSMLGLPGPATAATPATVAPTTAVPKVVDPNAAVGYNTLDAIHGRMVAAAKAPPVGLNVDTWNYFLAQVDSGLVPPDPMPIFQAAIPGFSRDQLLTDLQYWTPMSQYLAKNMGLTGLGIYGTLGALAMQQRGW